LPNSSTSFTANQVFSLAASAVSAALVWLGAARSTGAPRTPPRLSP
jgi:hypothetical protein